jgi:hypothetical protein
LTASLPGTEVFYILKANLAPEVLSLLIKLGSNFDVAKLDARTRDVAASYAARLGLVGATEDGKHRRETG